MKRHFYKIYRLNNIDKLRRAFLAKDYSEADEMSDNEIALKIIGWNLDQLDRMAPSDEYNNMFYSCMMATIERQWANTGKTVLFMERGMSDLLNTIELDDMTATEAGIPTDPVAVAWHPDDRLDGVAPLPMMIGAMEVKSDQPSPSRSVISFMQRADGGKMTSGFIHEEVSARDFADNFRHHDPNAQEVALVYSRLMFKIGLYMKAFPRLVRSGIPTDIKERAVKHAPGITPSVVSLHPRAKDSPNAHFRRGHFRCLRHEKFKRGPNGEPRIIFIDPTTVGEINPKMVQRAEV